MSDEQDQAASDDQTVDPQKQSTENPKQPTENQLQPTENQDQSAAKQTPPSRLKYPARRSRDELGLGKLLYTHNPFYLISCFLIIYGVQQWGIGGGDAWSKASSMTGGLAAYCVLMTLTCVAVVRLGKIWEDARSIFLLVLMSIAALSTAFDELCIENSTHASGFAVLGVLLSVFVCEGLVRACHLKLSLPYRLSLYLLLGVFFVSPVLLGATVRHRLDWLANSGSLLFSFACAGALLVMIPALRRGEASARANGSPWRWPWYPLTGFFILAVLSMIRSHAIWMSFGFNGRPVTFEPLLLLPVLAAVVVMMVETGLGQRNEQLVRFGLAVSPLLLLLGMANQGMSHLPPQTEMARWSGSGWTLTLAVVGMMCGYFTLRRIRFAELGTAATLFLAGSTAKLPTLMVDQGLQPWMLTSLAAAIFAATVWRYRTRDWLWTAQAAMIAYSIFAWGHALEMQLIGDFAAIAFAVLAMLIIGKCFDTPLSAALRILAATVLTVGSGYSLYRWLTNEQPWSSGAVSIVLAGLFVSTVYVFWIKRSGWFIVAGLQAAVLSVLIVGASLRSGRVPAISWPISSGLGSLALGVVITTSKTGFFAGAKTQLRESERLSKFKRGL